MTQKNNLVDFFSEDSVGSNVAFKNKSLKKAIIKQLDIIGDLTIPELTKELNISTPKITSLINDLMEEGLITDMGKVVSTGGRRANIYGLLNSACYFIGVDVKRYYVNIGLMDFKKHLITTEEKINYPLENTQQSLNALIEIIKNFIAESGLPKEKILAMGINLSGRVNNNTGYSFSYFHFQEESLATTIEKEIGVKAFLENDSNAMAYGEFLHGVVHNETNVLYIHLDHGTGSGIIIDGKVYYGRSGFSGEFGHIPFFNNDIICGCGKKGCLETEVSGIALLRKAKEKLQQGSASILTTKYKDVNELTLEDLIDAAKNEDVLMIELLAEMGDLLGKAISALINLFNPELVVLGGILAESGDYLRLPTKTAINKYSLSLVNNDTQLKNSKLGETAGVIGACLIARNKMLML
ncbi:MAG: ROK family transcriptional regulator [Chitinophagaceae bacterium]